VIVYVPHVVPDALELTIGVWSFLGLRRVVLEGWRVL
jgi:hypothetical protein